MSIIVARKKRSALYLSICGLLAMVAAVSAVSARDPSGVTLRVGMIMMTVGAAMWLPWRALIPTVLAIWLGPNYVRSLIEDETLFGTNMLLELPGLIGLGFFASMARNTLRGLEDEDLLLGATNDEVNGVDEETGVYDEHLLRPALEAELVRSRRFNREFALVLVGIDPLRQRFDYRDEDDSHVSFIATAQVLRNTRAHIDRAYRYDDSSFALILPESGAKEVTGMVRRLRRVARQASPAEGEVGGPMPMHFGATFFPQSATTPDDLLRRAEVALRIAEKSSSRVQIDGAEAPDMPAPETLRRIEPVAEAEEAEAALETAVASLPEPVAIGSNGNGHAQPAATEIAEPLTAKVIPLPTKEPALLETGWPTPARILATLPAPAAARPSISDNVPWREPASQPVALHSEELSSAAEPEADVASAELPVEEPTQAPEPVTAAPVESTLKLVESPAEAVEEPVAVASPAPSPEPVAVAAGALASSEPVTIAAASMSSAAEPLGDDVADILKHLDETLDLIRSLRTGSGS